MSHRARVGMEAEAMQTTEAGSLEWLSDFAFSRVWRSPI